MAQRKRVGGQWKKEWGGWKGSGSDVEAEAGEGAPLKALSSLGLDGLLLCGIARSSVSILWLFILPCGSKKQLPELQASIQYSNPWWPWTRWNQARNRTQEKGLLISAARPYSISLPSPTRWNTGGALHPSALHGEKSCLYCSSAWIPEIDPEGIL